MNDSIFNCLRYCFAEGEELSEKKISGKRISKKIRNSFIKYLPDTTPTLGVVNTGIDEASNYYVKSQKKIFGKYNLNVEEFSLNPNCSEDEALDLIKNLNDDSNINGIQVQVPLPKKFNQQRILDSIDPLKDVDCQSSLSLGKVMSGYECHYYPNTAYAVKFILNYYKLDLAKKRILILNRSNVVGKPLAMMLLEKGERGHGSPMICHSRTGDLGAKLQEADILVIAIGKPNWLKVGQIKKNCVIMDVGINSVEKDGKPRVTGDVDTESVLKKCKFVTPVPNGIGSVTTSLLMYQTVMAAYLQHQ